MSDHQAAELERAFETNFVPDSYELVNVYKLYDSNLMMEENAFAIEEQDDQQR